MTPVDLEADMTVIAPAQEADLEDTTPETEAEAVFKTAFIIDSTDCVDLADYALEIDLHDGALDIHVPAHHYGTFHV